jgi:hypothetical protein
MRSRRQGSPTLSPLVGFAPLAADQRFLFDRYGTTFVAMIWRSLRSLCQERSFQVFAPGFSPGADGFALLLREDPANDSIFSPRSNRQMIATLRTNFSCVTIAPHENPN